MSEIMTLVMALLAGLALGGMFYGGLWWTVYHRVSSRKVGVWLLGSFLLRASIALSGFYFVAQHDWRAVLACLLGFLFARLCVMRLTPAYQERKDPLASGIQS